MLNRLILISLALAGTGAAAAAKGTAGETVIPFVSSLSNIEWKAASNDSLYLRGGRGEWYFVRTTNRCSRLRAASAIGLQTSAGGQLDRHGAIMVQGVRCPVASIVHSDGPPRKARRKAG